ncbi:FecR domain-containing protein [Bordetella genomosp. 13]|uniref:FecR domain-containing protein n=1 Tax=Bordetella genomosp. 13 TaxID=463040 RepID=UPI0011A74D1E|nr:FecR domain-containing protein [Bordetella genomosp. 13]
MSSLDRPKGEYLGAEHEGTPASAAGQLYAAGLPLAPRVAREASRWYVLFMSGKATEADRHAWQDWRDSHPDHARAWTHLSQADARLRGVAGPAACEALSAARRGRSRRVLVCAALAGAVGGPLLWAGTRATWQRPAPGYATGVAERREFALADQTRILLNADSAVEVEYGARRVVRLLRGEACFTTGHAGPHARHDFVVETPFGQARALGTRFIVRRDEDSARIAVLEGAVELTPGRGGRAHRLDAGAMARLTDAQVQPAHALSPEADSWMRGELAADDMPVARFLAELGRYRPGLIWHDDRAGALRISGLFPLADTDRALDALGRLLPVTVRRVTPYWVIVTAAG